MTSWIESVEEAKRLEQWLEVANNLIGEEELDQEIRQLRAASQLIEDRICSLENMLQSMQWNRNRLAEVEKDIRDNCPI